MSNAGEYAPEANYQKNTVSFDTFSTAVPYLCAYAAHTVP